VTRVRTLAMPRSAPPDDVNVDDTPTRSCTAHTHTTRLLTALDTHPQPPLFGVLRIYLMSSGVSRFALNSTVGVTALHCTAAAARVQRRGGCV